MTLPGRRLLWIFVPLVLIGAVLLTGVALGAGGFVRAFSGDGKATLDLRDPQLPNRCGSLSDEGCPDVAYDGAIGSEGRLTAVGYTVGRKTGRDFAVVRLLPSGRLDRTFAEDGVRALDIPGHGRFTEKLDVANAVALTRDGDVLVAGVTERQNGYTAAVARFRRDGGLDAGFSRDGIWLQPIKGLRDRFANDVLALPRGAALVSGCTHYELEVFKLTPRGFLAQRFGRRGRKRIRLPGQDVGEGCLYESALQPDGKILLAGNAFHGNGEDGLDFLVIRLLPNGDLDRTFAGDGIRTIAFGGYSYDYAWDLALQRDGGIVIGGNTAPGGGDEDNRVHFALARLTPNGRLDRRFSGDGRTVIRWRRRLKSYVCAPAPHPYEECVEYGAGLALTRRGGILIAGRQHLRRRTVDAAAARLDRRGALDGKFLFGFGSRGVDAVHDVVPAGSSLYLVGESYGRRTASDIAIARLRR